MAEKRSLRVSQAFFVGFRRLIWRVDFALACFDELHVALLLLKLWSRNKSQLFLTLPILWQVRGIVELASSTGVFQQGSGCSTLLLAMTAGASSENAQTWLVCMRRFIFKFCDHTCELHIRLFCLTDVLAGIAHAIMHFLWSGVCCEGMVLLELITRKKIGEDGFARRTPAKLFALEAEEVRQESPQDAPDSLLNLAAMWVDLARPRGLFC